MIINGNFACSNRTNIVESPILYNALFEVKLDWSSNCTLGDIFDMISTPKDFRDVDDRRC